MRHKTPIEWAVTLADRTGRQARTWSPVTGCTGRGPGCRNCYAQALLRRFPALAGLKKGSYEDPRLPRIHLTRLADPYTWRRPSVVFVGALGDLFHPAHDPSLIRRIYHTMAHTGPTSGGRRRPQGPGAPGSGHIYIVLTKWPERIPDVVYADPAGLRPGEYLANVWHLVSVEAQAQAWRVEALLALGRLAPWPVLGVSAEPLLGPLDLRPWLRRRARIYGPGQTFTDTIDRRKAAPSRRRRPRSTRPRVPLPRINWIIDGGETGSGARPASPQWFSDLRDQAEAAGIPYYHKHNGRYRRLSTLERPTRRDVIVRRAGGVETVSEVRKRTLSFYDHILRPASKAEAGRDIFEEGPYDDTPLLGPASGASYEALLERQAAAAVCPDAELPAAPGKGKEGAQ